ncbi:hypothetical protein [Pseudofrankia inefficax]|uniref:hypothetical protein n=1 Tax=Pseudofrankia inefficax (strain DSM 45817 / CECT 9037 / DDB 130130 / EuI1c) TaxID=298654 RepID=UPI0001BFB726|nr:hypothetical protein [Pseudofrankia inefficax]
MKQVPGRRGQRAATPDLARAETVVSQTLLFARTSRFWIDEDRHGPAGARRFRYLPTFMLRG